jgi:hypothetical protein
MDATRPTSQAAMAARAQQPRQPAPLAEWLTDMPPMVSTTDAIRAARSGAATSPHQLYRYTTGGLRFDQSGQASHGKKTQCQAYRDLDVEKDPGGFTPTLVCTGPQGGRAGMARRARGSDRRRPRAHRGSGDVARSGFARLTTEVALGHVGLVLGLEVSRLARNNADWTRPGSLGQPAIPITGSLSRGREWNISGSQATRPVFLLRSGTPAESTIPHHDGLVDAALAVSTAKASALDISGLPRGFNTCCLRFMGDVATAYARLASGRLAGLYREGVEPSGSR